MEVIDMNVKQRMLFLWMFYHPLANWMLIYNRYPTADWKEKIKLRLCFPGIHKNFKKIDVEG